MCEIVHYYSPWQKCYDTAASANYWFNTDTSEASWVSPNDENINYPTVHGIDLNQKLQYTTVLSYHPFSIKYKNKKDGIITSLPPPPEFVIDIHENNKPFKLFWDYTAGSLIEYDYSENTNIEGGKPQYTNKHRRIKNKTRTSVNKRNSPTKRRRSCTGNTAKCFVRASLREHNSQTNKRRRIKTKKR